MLLSNRAFAMMSRTLSHWRWDRKWVGIRLVDVVTIKHYVSQQGVFSVTVEKTRHLAPGLVT